MDCSCGIGTKCLDSGECQLATNIFFSSNPLLVKSYVHNLVKTLVKALVKTLVNNLSAKLW